MLQCEKRGVPSLKKRFRNESWRLGAGLLATTRDRLARRVEALVAGVILLRAEADHHQGLGAFVAERIEAAFGQHQGLILLEHRQRAIESEELRFSLQHHKNVILFDMRMQSILAALWR